MNTTPPDCAILGLGYLGLPLAQKLYERGSRVCAVKRSLTSDDINLPIRLDTADLNRPDVFQTAFWQHWADKPTWFCLLPPSPLAHYADTLKQWLALAEHMGVQHIVYTSSTSVYGNAVRVCDENTPPDPQTETAVQILAAEKILLAGRIPHIDILRLGGLYSATRHPLDRPASPRQAHPQYRRTLPPRPCRILRRRGRQTRPSRPRFRFGRPQRR